MNVDYYPFMLDKNSFAELLNKEPNLGKQMQQYHDRAKERDRGISR